MITYIAIAIMVFIAYHDSVSFRDGWPIELIEAALWPITLGTELRKYLNERVKTGGE